LLVPRIGALVLFCLFAQIAAGAGTLPEGPFSNDECTTCHSQHNPQIVQQWQNGPHGPLSKTTCSDCHGDTHRDAAATARANKSCTHCHTGAESHSYATSKHGVIVRLENRRQDWGKPLQAGQYRAPSCSYCHLHNNDHGDSMKPSGDTPLQQGICTGCHSPRYVRELFASGRRQLDIAKLKRIEGLDLIINARAASTEKRKAYRDKLNTHLHNILLGIGHQSPDYQWWHGQAALDGDLIGIKELISNTQRQEVLRQKE